MENLGKLSKKEIPEKEIPEYRFKEIEQLEKPMTALVQQLKKAIDHEEYDVVIGDDASARIPVMALRKVITRRLEQGNPSLSPEEKREQLKTFFVAGGHADNSDSLLEFFDKIRPQVKKKALFVTEYMFFGDSLNKVADLMERRGIPFDVAALFTLRKKSRYLADYGGESIDYAVFRNLGRKFYVGKESTSASEVELYHRKDISGVYKEDPWKKHKGAHAYSDEASGLKESREDVNLLADRVVDEIWGDKK